MTQDEIQELRDWSAKKMGWELLHIDYFGTPDETPRQKELESWLLDEVKLEEIGDFYIDVDKNFWMPIEEWLPDIDLNQCFMLVEKMREEGLRLQLDNFQGFNESVWCAVFNNGSSDITFNEGPNPALAIIMAAKATEE